MANLIENKEILASHYKSTVENVSLVQSDNLHFLGYFQQPDETLVSALKNLNMLFAEKISTSVGDVVLDVGCGTGGPACYIAQTTGSSIVGIDKGEQQILLAKKRADEKGLSDQVSFIHKDATCTEFLPNSFDAVLLIGSASHTIKKQLLSESHRVLKDND